MTGIKILLDALGRSTQACHEVLSGLSADTANTEPPPGGNSITWLVWHIGRVQDSQIADLSGRDQVWTANGWYGRFGLDLPPESMGYGHSAAEAASVRVTDTGLLLGYLDDAAAATAEYVRGLSGAALDEVVDEAWDPPVTRGVRLVSIATDMAEHAGQAGYVRGLLERA